MVKESYMLAYSPPNDVKYQNFYTFDTLFTYNSLLRTM